MDSESRQRPPIIETKRKRERSTYRAVARVLSSAEWMPVRPENNNLDEKDRNWKHTASQDASDCALFYISRELLILSGPRSIEKMVKKE